MSGRRRLLKRWDSASNAVSLATDSGIVPGRQRVLFEDIYRFDVHPAGDRFFFLRPMSTGEVGGLVAVLNFIEESNGKVRGNE